MAIVKMNKITIAAPEAVREQMLAFLQKRGCVELTDIKNTISEEEKLPEGAGYYDPLSPSMQAAEREFEDVEFTYEFLKRYSTAKKAAKKEHITQEEFNSINGRYDWKNLYNESKKLDTAINENRNKDIKLKALVEHYTQWTNFDVSSQELSKLKNISWELGTVSRRYEKEFFKELEESAVDMYTEKISEKQQDVNVFILFHKDDEETVSDILKKYGFSKMNLDISVVPASKIEQLSSQIEELESEEKSLIASAQKLSENLSDIEKVYDYMASVKERQQVQQRLVKTERTFVAMGWIPEDKAEETKLETSKVFKDAVIIIEEAQETDDIPILLKNNKLVEPFEAVTGMYALPTVHDVDPTPVLMPFFLLFFGMMMADIGYGLVMLVGTWIFMKVKEPEGDFGKLIKVLFLSSFPTIIFGILYGSFFGGAETLLFGESAKLKPLWVAPVDDTMSVLIVSIALGILHLFVGLGVKAYMLIKSGKPLYAVTDVVSWYLLLTGLILIFLVPGIKTIATAMAVVGALTILLTQGRENKTIVGKFFGGFYSLYGITSYLGDILSYSRLLALGLASGLIGWSFNLLIELLGKGPAALILGPIIFLAGHTFNLLNGALGAYVHTSRLEYLEFFGKFYEGGGRAFDPFKIKTKFVKLVSDK